MTVTENNYQPSMDLRGIVKDIRPGTLKLGGHNPQGDEISFTNFYMEWNRRPFFGICGEIHFSRLAHDRWEEALLKMKAAGINIVATYVFWIHHEEEQGQFRWDGDLNVRRFIQLCARHDLKVILRVGPFCHGECRNGGLPDWLYGRPFEIRSNDEDYLRLVQKLYQQIGTETAGLMFKDGGPIIGIQLENEYMHAGAPWEMTGGQAGEFISSGRDGEKHMRRLKELAVEAGLVAPVYTSTGWGGAAVLKDEVLPLYGGYAYTPWNITAEQPKQPPTTEFLFQDYHSNTTPVPAFEAPPYAPEDYPYACCEMGGGMQTWYLARFQVAPETVEAMSIQKIAGGCNFIGYYVFHGGSQPVGKHAYMNERTNPRISYDYQAPIGEFGQIRESYRRLKLIFSFARAFGENLCGMATVLPDSAAGLKPEDAGQVRYAVRVRNSSGYVFLNNVQDHAEMKDHEGVALKLELDKGTLRLPAAGGFSLKKGVSAILPFNFRMGGLLLKYATAQPITCITKEGVDEYFFFTPEGMSSEFCFDDSGLAGITAEQGAIRYEEGCAFAVFEEHKGGVVKLVTLSGETLLVHLLTRDEALNLWETELCGERRLVLSETPFTVNDGELIFYSRGSGSATFAVYPALGQELSASFGSIRQHPETDVHGFTQYELELPDAAFEVHRQMSGSSKAALTLPAEVWEHPQLHELILAIDYDGDVGNASINGLLAGDHFWNGDIWELGLLKHQKELREHTLDLYIAPERRGQLVRSDSAMAVQHTFIGQEIAEIRGTKLIPEWRITVKPLSK